VAADAVVTRNPFERLDRYELRHLPAHLVAVGRLDDLHGLLRLGFGREPSAASVENAWFSAKDAANEFASYAEDVELAWKSEIERGADDVPLELSYALMRSSVRAMTIQVPDALILALVERGVWSAEQGLSHAWQRPADTPGERWTRTSLLVVMLRHLQPERRSVLFKEVRDEARRLEHDRAAAILWELVPAAPEPAREPLVEEALERTRKAGPRALADVLPRVPPAPRGSLWRELVGAFGRLTPEQQDQALNAVAPQLTVAEVEQAIALTRKMRGIGAQGRALAELAERLPEKRRLAIAREELAAVPTRKQLAAVPGSPRVRDWADRLTALCPVLPAPWADAALDVAAKTASPIARAELLSVLAQALDPDDPRRSETVHEAITTSREAGNALWHAGLMARLARACPEHERGAIWEEALAAARGLEPDGLHLEALRSMAPYLDADAVAGFVELAHTVMWVSDRAELLALAAATQHADQRTALLREALRTTNSAESDDEVTSVIERLAPQLPDELLDEGLDCAERIEATFWRGGALAALAPYLDATQLRRALAAARAISDGADATRAILALAAAADVDVNRDIWERARALALAIRQPTERALALTLLARAAPEPERTNVLAEALTAARAIASPYERDDALTELAGDLAHEQRDIVLAEALEAMKRQDVGGDLHDRLRRMAPLLPPTLLHEAFRFAGGLDPTFRAHTIAALVPFLPAELRARACEEALMTGAARFENAGDKHLLIMTLAAHLPPQATWRAISLAMDIDDAILRPQALAALAEHLNEAERRKLLSDAELNALLRRERSAELKVRVERASVLAAAEREDLLDEVRAEETERRVPLLASLIPLLTGEARTRAVDHALAAARSLEHHSHRARSLAALAAVLPDELAGLAAEEALAAATASAPGTRCEALVAAAPTLPTADRERALREAVDDALASLPDAVQVGGQLERSLGRLAPALSTLPCETRGALVLRVVRELERFARSEVLRAVAAFVPALLPIQAAPSAGAIAEVESWWP
jgi:hypothetical protein